MSLLSLSCIQLFVTPWTAARQASLSFTNSQSLLKPMSTESVMPSNHLILCRPLLLPPSIFPSIRVFSNELALLTKWCLTLCHPWTAAHQASLSFTSSQSLLKLMFTELVMPSNHLIFCHPLLLLPSIFPSIGGESGRWVCRGKESPS